tara:strand:+ start:889 stop:1422 length:534 start_codon:yes stop_codon:yes gene_type:complete
MSIRCRLVVSPYPGRPAAALPLSVRRPHHPTHGDGHANAELDGHMMIIRGSGAGGRGANNHREADKSNDHTPPLARLGATSRLNPESKYNSNDRHQEEHEDREHLQWLPPEAGDAGIITDADSEGGVASVPAKEIAVTRQIIITQNLSCGSGGLVHGPSWDPRPRVHGINFQALRFD